MELGEATTPSGAAQHSLCDDGEVTAEQHALGADEGVGELAAVAAAPSLAPEPFAGEAEVPQVDTVSVDNFTNDSAMMIAWERALETKRGPDGGALFDDQLAEALAGSKGEALSANFGEMSKVFGFGDWREFHKTWVAIRTRFIDDCVAHAVEAGGFVQLVNLGAGMVSTS